MSFKTSDLDTRWMTLGVTVLPQLSRATFHDILQIASRNFVNVLVLSVVVFWQPTESISTRLTTAQQNARNFSTNVP